MGGAAQLQTIDPAEDAAIAPLTAADLVLPSQPHIGELLCPHCRFPTYRRTSKGVTGTFRDIFYKCRNVACGCSFKATLSIEYIITPSAIPDPEVTIPIRVMERIAGLTVAASAEPEPDPNQFNLFDKDH